jgi:EAL domain-containing protein (putative c-di-GMP-specific phosphodiesterase class I)
VNLSPRQFRQRDMQTLITNIIGETGLAAPFLKLELTESSLWRISRPPARCCRAYTGLDPAGD